MRSLERSHARRTSRSEVDSAPTSDDIPLHSSPKALMVRSRRWSESSSDTAGCVRRRPHPGEVLEKPEGTNDQVRLHRLSHRPCGIFDARGIACIHAHRQTRWPEVIPFSIGLPSCGAERDSCRSYHRTQPPFAALGLVRQAIDRSKALVAIVPERHGGLSSPRVQWKFRELTSKSPTASSIPFNFVTTMCTTSP